MNSNYNIQYSERGQLVYFEVDMKELFNVDLNTPDVISALNKAFNVSKSVVPIKTGLMLRSYTMKKISSTSVRCYFDPEKIIGKTRLGKTVKEYYPQYLVDTPKRYDWLQVLIKKFYDALRIQMEKLAKKNEEIKLDMFYIFMLILLEEQKRRKEEEIKRRKHLEEIKSKQKEKREAFIESIKNRRK